MAHETADQTGESAGPDDETRRRFREALERKKRETHRANEHHDAGGKGVGESQVISSRRQFRRKSG